MRRALRNRQGRSTAPLAVGLAMAVFALTFANNGQASDDSAAAVITVFETEDLESVLGINVGTYLNLQVWRTLKRTYVNDRMTFSQGTVWWKESAIDSHAAAERAARDLLAQMTLWGAAFGYGDGVVVQAYLSVPKYNDFRSDNNEVWSIEVLGETLSVDMPRRRYDFSPIEISRESVRDLRDPFAFDLCDEKVVNPEDASRLCRKGRLSSGFTALQHDSKCSKIITLDSWREEGWICNALPSDRNSEVVDFVAGILRVMRGDWPGANASLTRVTENEDAEIRLKIDAQLMLAMVAAKSNQPSESIAQEAFSLRPNDRVAFKYLVMSKLTALKERIEQGQSAAELAAVVGDLLGDNRILLAPDDPWLSALESVLESAAAEQGALVAGSAVD